MNVIVPNLEHAGEVCGGNAKLVKQMETVQVTAAAENLKRYLSATSNAVITTTAGLGMRPLKTNRDIYI